MFKSESMLLLVYSVFVCAHGSPMKADGEVQQAPQSKLLTVEPREPVQSKSNVIVITVYVIFIFTNIHYILSLILLLLFV